MDRNSAAFQQLRLAVGDRLARIEDMVREGFGLRRLTRYTLIARDPENDDMIVLWTNEPAGSIADACRVALRQEDRPPVGLLPGEAERG